MKTAAQLLKLKAVENRQVHSIGPDQRVLEALQMMAQKNVGALPVMEAGQQVVHATSQFSDVAAVVYDFSPSRAGEPLATFYKTGGASWSAMTLGVTRPGGVTRPASSSA